MREIFKKPHTYQLFHIYSLIFLDQPIFGLLAKDFG